MRALTLVLLLTVAILPLKAEPVRGRCLIEVGGHTYLNGPCTIEDEGGILSVGVGYAKFPASKFFAYVSQEDDEQTGAARWNGVGAGTQGDIDLGTVTREDDCWLNATTKICARR